MASQSFQVSPQTKDAQINTVEDGPTLYDLSQKLQDAEQKLHEKQSLINEMTAKLDDLNNKYNTLENDKISAENTFTSRLNISESKISQMKLRNESLTRDLKHEKECNQDIFEINERLNTEIQNLTNE